MVHVAPGAPVHRRSAVPAASLLLRKSRPKVDNLLIGNRTRVLGDSIPAPRGGYLNARMTDNSAFRVVLRGVR
ncbi:hypothetical protein SCOCK_620038 [Actinacidiphila cocklensis]|uniref:Uncharacterized protein n=1 Tax=Actinacidiphila cocklensis TaxID=887465 RepID=A0A9W4GV80_9ACTN|nr:hypothetical protein SCOCK_620038 [Actinacidiphila cocklensis]